MTSASDHLAVVDAIEQLPADLRAALALGPLDDPDCRICVTLKHLRGSCLTDTVEVLLDFHDLGPLEFEEATVDALGKDQRINARQSAAAQAYMNQLERKPPTNIERVTVESLAGNVMWWRCLFVYAIAGWRAESES